MSARPFTLPLDSTPPNFRLKGTDGKYYSLNDLLPSELLVIFFTCNHCPYVTGSDEITRQTVEKYQDKNIVFVGINSNNALAYPEDSYDKMIERMQQHHFPWIYLWDEKQEAARDYGALRTPHFFVFNKMCRLIYTGRGIDAPRDPSKMTVNDLENAMEDYFQGRKISKPLTNPIGCNIKWLGKDKHWMPEDACDLI